MQSTGTSILIGGLSCAVLSTLIQVASTMVNSGGQNPILGAVFGCLGCLIGLTSGLIAVWHYTGEYELTLKSGEGVKLGALAGVVSALVAFLLVRVLMFMGVMPTASDVIEQLADSPGMENAGGQLDMAVQWIEISMGWGGLIIGLVVGSLFGLLGGMMGAAMFKKGSDDEDDFLADQ